MHSRRQLILANAPSTPQISLPSRSGHSVAILELCSPRGEVPWNITVVNRRVLDLSRAMTRTVSV